ncbi:AraC family transcriptional regulator [Lactobacillus sp. ESL0791]|uniref:AraC family transcriptional regulator n=1 Tax=Lactobacillus sp. ESL0791 TaxID=2983234 RepID=UPI0023F97480|nr:AraC family transcriptional regulator [Lactobacillus sp. ESL0791]MDF7638725.1 AraC family transcriptional regulator [Lactobacillus sp. ESL0791]
MYEKILQILRQNNGFRDWNAIEKTFNQRGSKLKIVGRINRKPIYEFFNTYSDNLVLNSNAITISVQPVKSFIPFHIHDYMEMNIPLVGDCVVETEHEKVRVQQDDLLFIGIKTPHRVEPIKKDGVVLNIQLRSSAFSLNELNFLRAKESNMNISNLLFSLLSDEEHGEGRYSLFNTDHDQKIVNLIYDIIDEYYHPQVQTEQIIKLEMLTLFSLLIRKTYYLDVKVTDSKNTKSNLLSLLLYIEENYNDITLEKMATHFGFNPNYLSDYLKSETGLSFIKLVQLQRINIAAEYLTYTKASVERIANKVGYENASYFYKIFKQYFAVSPSKYRLNTR